MIADGDVVKIDVTAEIDGLIVDAARTVCVPPVSPLARALDECARAAFECAMVVARPGRPVREIGAVIQREVTRRGFFVLRELAGHGVGRAIHEAPEVPNYPDPWSTAMLHDGLVIAVEPIVIAAPATAVERSDGWTIATSDRGLAVHHENTIVIRDGAPLILTE